MDNAMARLSNRLNVIYLNTLDLPSRTNNTT